MKYAFFILFIYFFKHLYRSKDTHVLLLVRLYLMCLTLLLSKITLKALVSSFIIFNLFNCQSLIFAQCRTCYYLCTFFVSIPVETSLSLPADLNTYSFTHILSFLLFGKRPAVLLYVDFSYAFIPCSYYRYRNKIFFMTITWDSLYLRILMP